MRQRTTKGLARRIELDHWMRAHPLRTWYRRAWLAGGAIALLWLGAAALLGDATILRPGPVSTRHALFGDDCAQCHEPWRRVQDASCKSCHDGPRHAARATFEPACAACHLEHRGAALLAPALGDAHCTQCHLDLQVSDGAPLRFASGIARFGEGHPEFAAARAGAVDPSDLKFNHLLHLRGNLKGPTGPVTLSCASCHAPDLSRTRMTTPAYEAACAGCHPLEFDAARFPDVVAPHETPALVRGALRERYAAYAARNPQELRGEATGGGGRRRPGAPTATAEAAGVEAWVQRSVLEAEARLYDADEALDEKRCARCHTTRAAAAEGAPPAVAPVSGTAVWMPHARFDHDTHRVLACVACHAKAPESAATRDVLLPSVETCRSCHADAGAGARSACVTCHVYHDPSERRDLEGRMGIPDLTSKRRGR